MAERNIGYTFCNFSWSQAAHSWELSDVSRLSLPGCWKSCPGQALAALGYIDTGMTWIFVYFLSECRGHSVLRRTMCVHKRSCQHRLGLGSCLSWKAPHPWGRPLLLECMPRSCSVLCSRSPVQACRLLPAPSPDWNFQELGRIQAERCSSVWASVSHFWGAGLSSHAAEKLKGLGLSSAACSTQSLPEAGAGGISEGFFAIS